MLKIKDKENIDIKKLKKDVQMLSIAFNCSQQKIIDELYKEQDVTFEYEDFLINIKLVEKVD